MSLMTSCVLETFGYTGMDLSFSDTPAEADQGSSLLRRLTKHFCRRAAAGFGQGGLEARARPALANSGRWLDLVGPRAG